MADQDDIARLKRKHLLTQVVSLFVGLLGAAAVCLYFEPSVMGVAAEQRHAFQGQWVLLLLGIALCVVSAVSSITASRRTRRLLWIRGHIRPVAMLVELEVDDGSDLTEYYARLTHSDSGDTQQSAWRVSLWQVPRRIRQHLGMRFPADVFFDPGTGTPALIEFEHGTLWVMAGGSCQRLGGDKPRP